MKISGFTFIKNGCKLGFPFIQSIKSILPICDEFIINVGNSDDGTLDAIKQINDPKIKIIQTNWNDKMRVKGFTYAQQKMIAQYSCTGDWAFYIEGDEVVHEQDLPKIKQAMELHLNNPKVETLVFDYLHFYGNIKTYAWSPAWYRRAPRIIRNTIRSYAPDGLYWLVFDDNNKKARYPFAAPLNVTMYHYGWVRPEDKMINKLTEVEHLWDKKDQAKDLKYKEIDQSILREFTGIHPAIIKDFFPKADTIFQANPNHILTKREKKHRIASKFEKWFNLDLSHKNFKL